MPTSARETQAETSSRSSGLDEYSWEIVHDGTVAEYGAVLTGERHPWTGSTADVHFEVGAELFDQACTCAMEDSRDAIVEARAEGRPEPDPVRSVTVRMRDHEGTDLVIMTAHLPFEPITRADLDAYHEMMAGDAEAESALLNRPINPVDSESGWYAAPSAPRPTAVAESAPVPEGTDPDRQTIGDLVEEAGELRHSVTDPDECRRKVFYAEQRLAEAKRREQQATTEFDDVPRTAAADRVTRCARRVTFWHTRLAQSTEIYLEAAALDAEAEQLERAHRAAARARP